MEAKQLDELFKGYDPEISSDNLFMSALQRRLDSVEMVRSFNAAVRRRQRRAVVWSALAGFVAGVVMTLVAPYIMAWLSRLESGLPAMDVMSADVMTTTITFAVIAAVSVVISLGVYDLASDPVGGKVGHRPV